MYIYQCATESFLRDVPFKWLSPKRFKEHPSYALCTGAHSRSYLAQCALLQEDWSHQYCVG